MISMIYMAALFVTKVLNNALGAAKTILIQRSRWLLAGVAVMLSELVSLWITKSIVTDDNFLAMIIVAVAGGVGCSLACILSEKTIHSS